MSSRMSMLLPVLGSVVFCALGVQRVVVSERLWVRAAENARLEQAIREADAVEDDRAAVEAYMALGTRLPEVESRILERQWSIALALLHQVQLAKYNRALEGEVSGLYERLEEHLDSMKERCGVALSEGEPVPREVAWRIHNIEGAVRLLSAFTVLETERNWKKVRAVMWAAIRAFKSAIEAVDAAAVSGFERNVPRWNLELLHADIYIKKLTVMMPDKERLELRENLEAVIPEKGGYAPGEPMEMRIRK